jgi:hypothetical protein
MSTLPPPFVKEFPADSLEKQVYTLVESLAEYLPTPNDRNRLSYSLFKYMTGEGDEPLISIKSAKVTLKGISEESLAEKIAAGLQAIKGSAHSAE